MTNTDVRRQIKEYLDNQTTLAEFSQWLDVSSWGLGVREKPVRDMIFAVKLAFSEEDLGQFRQILADLLARDGNPVIQ